MQNSYSGPCPRVERGLGPFQGGHYEGAGLGPYLFPGNRDIQDLFQDVHLKSSGKLCGSLNSSRRP